MKKKTRKSVIGASFGGILALITLGCQNNASAMIEKDGSKWWDIAEMPAIKAEADEAYENLSEAEKAKLEGPTEGCEDFEKMMMDWNCRLTGKEKFLYQNRDKGYYTASEILGNTFFVETIWPSENKIKYWVNAPGDSNSHLSLDELVISWRDEELAKKYPYHWKITDGAGNLLEGAHQFIWTAKTEDEGKIKELILNGVEGLGENNNGELSTNQKSHFMVNGRREYSASFLGEQYASCIDSEDYIVGMECHKLYNEERVTRFFPMWEEDEKKHYLKEENQESKKEEENNVENQEDKDNEWENTNNQEIGSEIREAEQIEWVAAEAENNEKKKVENWSGDLASLSKIIVQNDEDKDAVDNIRNNENNNESETTNEASKVESSENMEVPKLNDSNQKRNWFLLIIPIVGAMLGLFWLIILLFKRREEDEEDKKE